MNNFKINNKADVAEIDIIGDIGESWFGDGITMKDIRNQLDEVKEKPLVVNVSSLGGSVNDAFAIHDFLKLHKAHVKVNIFGLTASSGTLIAMGGDEVVMSDNAMFLIHNVWTSASGNANDFRELAEELDLFDQRVVNIYQKNINKNGKNKKKSEIMKLMEAEKWIDATEAIAWGFVNSKLQDNRVIDNSIRNKINENEYLPNINKMENKLKDSALALLARVGITFEKGEEVKDQEIHDSFEVAINDKIEEIVNLNKTIEGKDAEIVALKEADKSKELADLQASFEAKEVESKEVSEKLNALQVEFDTLKVSKSGVDNVIDPAIATDPVELTPADKVAKELLANFDGHRLKK